MSLSAKAIDALLSAGATAEMLGAVMKAELESEAERRAAKREGARLRKQRQRAKGDDVAQVTRDIEGHGVTERDNLPLSPSSPRPPSTTNPNQVPPYSPPAAKPAEPDLKAVAEEIWMLQPVVGGKRKATRPDVLKALRVAVDRRGQDPDRIAAACRAYYRLPDCRKDGGQYARGAAVLLAEDRWRDFDTPERSGRPQPKPEPAVYEAHVRHFRDTGEWKPTWGEKPNLEDAA